MSGDFQLVSPGVSRIVLRRVHVHVVTEHLSRGRAVRVGITVVLQCGELVACQQQLASSDGSQPGLSAVTGAASRVDAPVEPCSLSHDSCRCSHDG